ncbi:MAG: peptide MFS transporter [Mitsuaria chitosanitabida]|uniref:peptide MFS transporter n=1 Tax=Roseateles chitosanitabidus TaxID=65048 RepID=UPI001B010720|nr:peptide MFS transporter [Roseateles chitosanitabidus]MBO9689055.1 peptide MFS transporter [Roseateles chitosanitabidus]
MTTVPLSAAVDATSDLRARHDKSFLGHPAGLGWLAFCELWERFSYYGMQALLVLYLSNYLFMPEHIGVVAGMDPLRAMIESVTGSRSTQQLASVVFGLYTGFVYLTPIFGGLLADRVLGRTRTVVIGALLMAAGHFLMAIEAALLPALGCLLLGVGCFKGNIAAQVGDLYGPDDKRRASAFQIFMLAVQVAVIAAPIVCGTLGERVGWHWGFGAAGVGMLIGLFVYLAGRRFLPPEPQRAAKIEAVAKPPIGRRGVMQVVLLVAILPLLMLSIVGNQQFNNAYPLWSQQYMDMVVGGFTVPVTWLQSVDATVSFLTMLGSIAFWKWWSTRRREPDEVAKMALGCFVAAGAPALLLIPAMSLEAGGAKISILWTFAYTLVNDIGFANILPVGLALYSRASPRGLQGVMIGIYYLHLFFGNLFVGWLAGLLEVLPGSQFWLLHAALVAAAGAGLLLVKLMFGRLLAEDETPA